MDTMFSSSSRITKIREYQYQFDCILEESIEEQQEKKACSHSIISIRNHQWVWTITSDLKSDTRTPDFCFSLSDRWTKKEMEMPIYSKLPGSRSLHLGPGIQVDRHTPATVLWPTAVSIFQPELCRVHFQAPRQRQLVPLFSHSGWLLHLLKRVAKETANSSLLVVS